MNDDEVISQAMHVNATNLTELHLKFQGNTQSSLNTELFHLLPSSLQTEGYYFFLNTILHVCQLSLITN